MPPEKKPGKTIDFLNLIEQTRRTDEVSFGGERENESLILEYNPLSALQRKDVRKREREVREERIREQKFDWFPNLSIHNIPSREDLEHIKFRQRFPTLSQTLVALTIEEEEAVADRHAELSPVFAQNGLWDLMKIYAEDSLMHNLVERYVRGKISKHAGLDRRRAQAEGHILEQIVYDLYGSEVSEEGVLFGKSATNELYRSAIIEGGLIHAGYISQPDLVIVNNGQIRTFLEVTTDKSREYFSKKVQKFDHNVNQLRGLGLVDKPRLKFVVTQDSPLLGRSPDWKSRLDIDIVSLPITKDSLSEFTRTIITS